MAITQDVVTRPRLTWLDAQKPNTLMLFKPDVFEPVILNEDRISRILHHHNRRGGVASYLEAVELRICAWPHPGEPQVLLEKRNMAAMATLDLAFRLYSP